MSEKRYQVFVSSTYRDLAEERQKVAQVLQSMDCIPAGMELFPAIDEEQFEFIKKVVDDCDYYILILGGRYGSLGPDGLSYTEKEFDYAVSKGLRVIALVRDNTDALPLEKRETDETALQRLQVFRSRVAAGRLVKMWSTSEELPGLVAVSLQKTIKTYPAPGWVRDTGASPESLLVEINSLRKDKEQLQAEVSRLRSQIETDSETLASGSDPIRVAGTRKIASGTSRWELETTWDRILYHLGPHLYQALNDYSAKHELAKALVRVDLREDCSDAEVLADLFYTIRAQLEALGWVTVETLRLVKGGYGLFWSLTAKGKRKLFSLRLIERSDEHT